MKGCPLSCLWCHNPEGISNRIEVAHFEYKCLKCKSCVVTCSLKALSFEGNEILTIDRNKCNGCGRCAEVCPTGALKKIGKNITVDELIREIERDTPFHDSSGGGVTFSGGEPLGQPEFLKECLKELKKRHINTAVDTSGYASRDSLNLILPYTDIFLYDIKLFDPEEHRKYTGVSNEIIKDNLRFLLENDKNVILRFPIVPGITDTHKNVEGWLNFLLKLNGAKEINLLPYHDVEEKYHRLSKTYKMKVHSAPKEETLIWIKDKFEEIGLKVKIGG